MSTIIKIFKNLGTIVILLFQIVYVSIVDYLSTLDNSKKTKLNPHQYTSTQQPHGVSSNHKHKPLYKRTKRHDDITFI
jgi:hypothetical protein